METGASRSPEKTGQEGRIVMENAFAGMKTITLPRAGGTEQQSVFVCVNGRTFQVPRGKAVEVPEPVYEVIMASSSVREIAVFAASRLFTK